MFRPILAFLTIIISSTSLCNSAINFTPSAPKFNNSGFVLLSENTNKLIASNNPDRKIAPASLTKLMSLFVVASALEQKAINLNDKVLISKKAWKQPGSRMFIKAGDQVELAKLIAGSATASGNDATVALAEHVAGSVERFVEVMNQTAQTLGMTNTHFENATGLPNKKHVSTPRDLAILAQAWFKYHPNETKWFTNKYFSYNKIKQHNRNQLLWTNKYVDGMKTGYTKDAGYCLVTSALNNGERLIAVITGAKSKSARFEQSSQLLNYGYHFFENKKIATVNQAMGKTKVYLGTKEELEYGPSKNIIATVAKSSNQNIDIKYNFKKLKAPINKGDIVGEGSINIGDDIIKVNLIALESIERGGVWQLAKGYLAILIG